MRAFNLVVTLDSQMAVVSGLMTGRVPQSSCQAWFLEASLSLRAAGGICSEGCSQGCWLSSNNFKKLSVSLMLFLSLQHLEEY